MNIHPLFGKKLSEVTEEEMNLLTDSEYQELLEWTIKKELEYMVAEGMVEESVCPDTGETLYRKIS